MDPHVKVQSDLSIISFSGSPFWYNLEVPVALNVYRPLATLVAYINKYTWQSWMTKCVHQNKINILWRVSLSIVHSPISMRIYDCMRWMKANDFAVEMHLLTSTCSFTTRIQSYTNKRCLHPKVATSFSTNILLCVLNTEAACGARWHQIFTATFLIASLCPLPFWANAALEHLCPFWLRFWWIVDPIDSQVEHWLDLGWAKVACFTCKFILKGNHLED